MRDKQVHKSVSSDSPGENDGESEGKNHLILISAILTLKTLIRTPRIRRKVKNNQRTVLLMLLTAYPSYRIVRDLNKHIVMIEMVMNVLTMIIRIMLQKLRSIMKMRIFTKMVILNALRTKSVMTLLL